MLAGTYAERLTGSSTLAAAESGAEPLIEKEQAADDTDFDPSNFSFDFGGNEDD